MLDQGSIFVGQVLVPAAILTPHSNRTTLPCPEQFGVIRAYWEVHRDEESFVDGLRVVAELCAEDLLSAEDRMLELGRSVGLLLTIQTGSPLVEPHLVRIAECSSSRHLTRQMDYFYEEQSMSAAPFDLSELNAFATRLGALNPGTRRRIELVARWYGVAAAAQSPIDKYLAAWISLEAASPFLDERLHTPGARCPLCNHLPDRRARPRHDGAEHVIRNIAPELLAKFPFSKLVDLRNQVVHGDPADFVECEKTIHEIVGDIVLCAGSAVLSMLSVKTPLSGAGPRDISVQPTARSTIAFSQPLPTHDPYTEGWIPLDREILRQMSWHDDDGVPHRGVQPILKYDIRLPTHLTERDITYSLEHFPREGFAVDLVEPVPGESSMEWRPVERSPAWKRAWHEFGPSPKSESATSLNPD